MSNSRDVSRQWIEEHKNIGIKLKMMVFLIKLKLKKVQAPK